MIYNTFGGVRTLNQGALTARFDRTLRGPWKLFAYHTAAYNEYTRLDYRSTTGLGPWYDLSLGPTSHGLSLAAAHEYERFKGGRVQRAPRLSYRQRSRLPVSPAAGLDADFFYVPKFDDFDDYRLYAEISLRTLFWKDTLGLSLSWIEEYDSRPKPGVKPNDTLWLTSLSVRLGR